MLGSFSNRLYCQVGSERLIWKKAKCFITRWCPGIFVERLRKSSKTVILTGFMAEVRIRIVLNVNPNRYFAMSRFTLWTSLFVIPLLNRPRQILTNSISNVLKPLLLWEYGTWPINLHFYFYRTSCFVESK
jgi:hypothetical protein